MSERRSPTQPNEARELASFPYFSWDKHCAGYRDSTVFLNRKVNPVLGEVGDRAGWPKHV